MRIIDQLSGPRWMWLMLGGAVVATGIFSGCSSSDCHADKNCGPYDGASGSSASGGSGGQSGSSGHAGDNSVSGSGSGASGMTGMAGEGGAAGAGEQPCDATKTPTSEACLVTYAAGIFVAPSGDDSNLGSMSAPVKTISKAIDLAQAAGKFVIACDGNYDEQLNIVTGVELYGGFACPSGSSADWTLEAGGQARVVPTVRGIALTVASPVAPVTIENFEFDAQDGVLAGQSSIAAFVNESAKVTLTNVKLVAGKGVDGAAGTVANVTFAPQSMLDGNMASGNTGGAFRPIDCAAGGSSKGGQGGNGGGAVTGGGAGEPDLGIGKGGMQGSSCNSGGGGGDGKDAAVQAAATGAAKLGIISSTGWTGAAGNDGMSGTPAQGGGGGTGAASGGGGGGGGAGGCGGAGGTGGKAGGSSIALLLLSSTVSLVSCELTVSDAGNGGAGIAGQPGQSGGSAGVQTPDGCQGGKGGKGGAGGASGGGAGGISVGIAWSGTSVMAPTMTGSIVTTGELGAKGIGGLAGAGDGIDGVKQDVLKVP